jgi:hypothetical protein
MIPVKAGRFSERTVYAITVKLPDIIPPEPSPESALPKIKTALLGATPQTRDPTRKVIMAKI